MKNRKLKTETLKNFKNILLVATGTLILSFGTAIFIIPFDLVVGGVSSMAILIDKLLPFEYITVDMLIFFITWSLFLLGLIVLGRNFALKTLISAIIYPIGISIFSKLVSGEVFGGFFCLKATEYTHIAVILATLFGGLLVGTGCALAFSGGGSTGGVDIIAFILCKFFRRLKSPKVIFIVDTLTILSGVFIIGDMALTLLGIISAFIGATVIDKIFLGGSRAFVAQIVSENHSKICKEIIYKLGRTATLTDAVGAYSGKPKKIVSVSFTMNQYAELINIINNLDKNAFITIHQAHEINGEGWTR